MAKRSYSTDIDQHDPKEFRESLGSFGTTTVPGQNQLTELQAKVRQGVKHVELHLASRGKGQFNVQDVPDKYGFEQRRTIMQLAKLNKQTLSVHGSFDVVSFSGLNQGGFNEADRATSIKEIDETLKFASEVSKGGAVVFHIQGDPIPTSRGELNISKEYLDWLKKNNPKEYETLQKEYFNIDPLKRRFVDNIDQEKEVRAYFKGLKNGDKSDRERYNYYVNKAKETGREAWEEYFVSTNLEKTKVSPDFDPLIVVGNKISAASRERELVDFDVLKSENGKGLTKDEKNTIKKLGVDLDVGLSIDDYQKLNAVFTNGLPSEYQKDISENEFKKLKNKLVLSYEKIFEKNNFLQAQADKEFQKKFLENQIELLNLQKEDLGVTYEANKNYLEEIKDIRRKEREIISELKKASEKGDEKKLQELRGKLQGGDLSTSEKEEIQSIVQKAQREGEESLTKQDIERYNELTEKTGGLERRRYNLMAKMGQLEYQKVEKYDEIISQTNEQIKKLKEQSHEIKAITDETFKKNTTAMGELGVKALRYQLDMKQKAKVGGQKADEINKNVKKLQKEFDKETDNAKRNQIQNKILEEKYKLKRLVGSKDYKDIDLIERPLYLAPENMLPGYGSLSSLEEYKGTLRMAQQEFAKKILSDEPEYKKLREDYEKETGIKIDSKEKAVELAKRHVAGTFDNAHAGTWLKHFKREGDESEDERIARFNTWLNTQAEEMVKEGLVKHIHFNDTQAKDDDHNLLGQGILDIHDLRRRLRKINPKTGKPYVSEALIVEAGGRGGSNNMHLLNAFEIFNPSLFADKDSKGGIGYRLQQSEGEFIGGKNVSDWMEVKRQYNTRPQYSQYGMGYSTFRHQGPPQGQPRGSWSGTGFL